MVPKEFKFPKVDRRAAWNLWLLGLPDHQEKQADGTILPHPICPFQLFDPKLLPHKVMNNYKNNWRTVTKIMEQALANSERDPSTMTSLELNYC